MNWDSAVEGFWLARRRDLSEHTIVDYALTFRRFGAWIENGEVEKVKARQVNMFLDYLSEELHLSKKTQLNAWIALSSFWSWAAVELRIEHIMRDVRKPAPKRTLVFAFTEEEVRLLLAATGVMHAYDRRNDCYVRAPRPTAVRDVAIILVLVDTGLRASELCDLHVRDYDRKTGRLVVWHGKGDKQRSVYVGQIAQRALWRYIQQRKKPEPEAPLFEASRGGGAMNRTTLRKLIERLGERAKVEGATPHRFRHTFAVNFLRNGGSLAALQDLLGHSTMEMVRRYARLAEVDLQAAQKIASPADRWRL
jgi:integrase/recombinase XerD